LCNVYSPREQEAVVEVKPQRPYCTRNKYILQVVISIAPDLLSFWSILSCLSVGQSSYTSIPHDVNVALMLIG